MLGKKYLHVFRGGGGVPKQDIKNAKHEEKMHKVNYKN